MSTAIKIIMLIVSVILVLSVLLQESRSDGISGVIGGGAEQLFGKKKSSGYDAMLHKISFVSLILYFVLALVSLFIK